MVMWFERLGYCATCTNVGDSNPGLGHSATGKLCPPSNK